MKIFIVLLAVTITFATAVLHSQNDFLVLGKNGNVQYYSNKVKKWVELNAGTNLDKSTKIQLPEKSFVSVYHVSGKQIEFNRSGTYNLSNYIQNVSKDNKTFFEMFYKFLSNRFNSNDLILNNSHQKYMDTPGVTDRAVEFDYFELSYPKKIVLSNPLNTFSWFKAGGVTQYEFHITDKYNRDIYSTTVADTFIRIDLSKLLLTKDSNYLWYWKIPKTSNNSSNKSSETGIFELMSVAKMKTIKDTLAILQKHLGEINSYTAKVITSGYYEQKGMFEDAKAVLNESAKFAPNDETYNKVYKDFMKRHYRRR